MKSKNLQNNISNISSDSIINIDVHNKGTHRLEVKEIYGVDYNNNRKNWENNNKKDLKCVRIIVNRIPNPFEKTTNFPNMIFDDEEPNVTIDFEKDEVILKCGRDFIIQDITVL